MKADNRLARLRTPALLAAGVAIAILLVGGVPAEAAFPGANGKIVFTGFDPDTEIFAMEPDGSSVTQLTANGANDAQAAWSADGSRIAFASTRDGEAEIFVMDADGSNQTQLTANGSPDLYPAWSPDGLKLTFTRDIDPNPELSNPQIFVMNADGSGQTQLTGGLAAFGSEWSPDGSRIAFHRGLESGGVGIVVMNADGSGQTTISSGNDLNPSWSPDGTRLAFETTTGIATMNADGSGRTQLTTSGFEPVWSPDGTKIAFVRVEGGSPAIFTMNADGSGQTRLLTVTSPTGGTLLRPDWQPLVTQTVFADLSLTLAASAKSANTKKAFTYTITVENHGPGPAAGVVVTDVLDSNERFSSVTTSRGSCTGPAVGSSGTLSCDLGLLPVSETAEIVVVVELPSKKEFGSAKPQITNTASVGGSTADAVLGNNAATLVTNVVGP